MGSDRFDALRRRHLDRMTAFKRSLRKRRPPKDKGGSEAVTVEPDRPRLGEGGAAAALEFDDPS